ncbi:MULTISPECIES: hypothetical protein [unclassified Arcicella]|uniref:hypothetical protein n=1 Tax=unclassified Arcicella TaxID=2644986 RepID=UPI00285A6821|nr:MULTISPECIES: hypothetical protein [unclassified Arcicella]MDR6563850.1 DNA polymerase III delta prime subunit [Arcicella sp. BE51]MDR6813603.1 DNA polymerase III delta prime subunit [Arcicella sp. BE140]MDR6825016.1 DNA polymerase III delta prime subunit [Arcicella sp. BE139]
MSKFNYPVNDPFEARAVTEPTFEEDIFASNLYVNLDTVRGNEYLNDIKFDLGIGEDGSFHLTKEYVKLIFSGHIGSGKTIELKRLHQELNQTSQYFSVFISIEEELEISRFEPEDFYVLLITKLITQLQENGISRNTESLKELAKMFFSDTEVKKEISESIKDEIGVNIEANIGFLNFFKLGGSLKNLLAGETKTAKVVREVTRKNLLHLTQLLNDYLSDIRADIQREGLGQDILFIIDGSEKIMFEKYETLFVKDANVLIGINANMIMSVRIDAFYQIEKSPVRFTSQYVVPMIRTTNSQNCDSLCEIITKRIDFDTFFEDRDALSRCIHYSGGCIRQLFRIVNVAIRKTRGKKKIDVTIVEEVVDEIGNTMRESINKSYIEILKKGDFEPAEAKVKEMLYGLLLLKYNGIKSIKINPILEKYLRNANEL